MPELYMRYLGCLGLLEECSPHVPEEVRESILCAFEDATLAHGFTVRRVINRITIDVSTSPTTAPKEN